MERIAVISDVHGNLEALRTVLDDIRSRGIDEVYCLGDIIHKGVHTRECIELVRSSCAVVLQGNADDYYSTPHDLTSIESEVNRRRVSWHASTLTDEDRSYLQSLPLCHELYLSGRLVRLFHASPNSPYETITVLDGIDKRHELFLPSEHTPSRMIADVVIYGHVHAQTLNVAFNRTLINCGSVGNSLDYLHDKEKDGNPLGTTNAQYLILEGALGSTRHDKPFSFQFVRVPYDIEKELGSDLYNPERDAYEHELTRGTYRDAQRAMRAYGM